MRKKIVMSLALLSSLAINNSYSMESGLQNPLKLPDYITSVFAYLPLTDVDSVSLVSKKWNEAAHNSTGAFQDWGTLKTFYHKANHLLATEPSLYLCVTIYKDLERLQEQWLTNRRSEQELVDYSQVLMDKYPLYFNVLKTRMHFHNNNFSNYVGCLRYFAIPQDYHSAWLPTSTLAPWHCFLSAQCDEIVRKIVETQVEANQEILGKKFGTGVISNILSFFLNAEGTYYYHEYFGQGLDKVKDPRSSKLHHKILKDTYFLTEMYGARSRAKYEYEKSLEENVGISPYTANELNTTYVESIILDLLRHDKKEQIVTILLFPIIKRTMTALSHEDCLSICHQLTEHASKMDSLTIPSSMKLEFAVALAPYTKHCGRVKILWEKSIHGYKKETAPKERDLHHLIELRKNLHKRHIVKNSHVDYEFPVKETQEWLNRRIKEHPDYVKGMEKGEKDIEVVVNSAESKEESSEG